MMMDGVFLTNKIIFFLMDGVFFLMDGGNVVLGECPPRVLEFLSSWMGQS
jgi:hypothetical protein